jgi:hypothetical protein
MSARCKFTCVSKTISGVGENQTNTFVFTPVLSGAGENREFWKWTPSGKLEFACLNPAVNFEIGKDYYLDLSLAGE